MHQQPQADDDVELAVLELERVRVAALEGNVRALLRRALAGHLQHLFRRVDGGDVGSAARHQKRRTSRARRDVEDRAVLNASDHVRQHARLGRGDELADRPAESALFERAGHLGIGVRGIAVVTAGACALLGHATSLTMAPGNVGSSSAAQACLVFSRYAS